MFPKVTKLSQFGKGTSRVTQHNHGSLGGGNETT